MVKEYISITTFGMLFIIFSSFETALAMESNELPEEGISKKLTKTSDMDSRDPESSRNKVISELKKKLIHSKLMKKIILISLKTL